MDLNCGRVAARGGEITEAPVTDVVGFDTDVLIVFERGHPLCQS